MGLSADTIRLLSSKLGRRVASALAADVAGGGGGAGLDIGPWEDLAIPSDFFLPDAGTFEVEASDVPIEVELQYVTGAGSTGGFGIVGTDEAGETYAFEFNTYGDSSVNVTLRTMIPANVPWHVIVVGSMGTAGVTQGTASQLRRRTLA
jgi:hypothetical protein